MGEKINGYVIGEINRFTAGSPGEIKVFKQKSDSFMIDNLSSSEIIYFAFENNIVSHTGSNVGIIPAGETRSFDLQIGSLFIAGSAGQSPEVQLLMLTSSR